MADFQWLKSERPLSSIAVIQVTQISRFSMAAFGQKQTVKPISDGSRPTQKTSQTQKC